MSYEIPGFMFTMPADSLLAIDVALDPTADRRFRFVYLTAQGDIDWAIAGDHDEDGNLSVMGVMQNSPQNTNDPVQIMHDGISKVEVGSAGVTAGQRVVTVGTGTGAGMATDVTQSGDNQVALGIALQTGTSGALAAILLIPGGDRDATAA